MFRANQLIDFSDLENIQEVPTREIPNFFSLPYIELETLRVFKKRTVSFYFTKQLALYRISSKRMKFSKVLTKDNNTYSSNSFRLHENLTRTGQILMTIDGGNISRINRKSMKIMKLTTLSINRGCFPPSIISKCEKYLIEKTAYKLIRVHSLLVKCKKRILIDYEISLGEWVLGRKNLYIKQDNLKVITIYNLIDFLENKNKKKQSKKKGTKSIKHNNK